MVSAGEVKVKLAKHYVDKSKPEWNVKKLCWDMVERSIPEGLNGEILIAEHVEDGKVKGWITVQPDVLADLITKFKAKTFDPAAMGWREILDKWKAEGVDFGV
jgi:hypothetical protein